MKRFSLLAASGTRRRAVLLLAAGAAGVAGGGGALAVASVPDSSGVIHACYEVTTNASAATVPATTPGNVRIIDPEAGQTCNPAGPGSGPPAEAELSWNQSGPPGAPGPSGANGSNGAPGPPGASGVPGSITVNNPPVSPKQPPIGEAVLGSGRRALTLPFVDIDLSPSPNPGSVPRKSPGRSQYEAITLERGVTSDQGFSDWAKHTRFATASLVLSDVRAPAGKRLDITLTGATITSIHIGSNGPGGPVETITIGSPQPMVISYEK